MLSGLIVPGCMLAALVAAAYRRLPAYDLFVEGAREGIGVAVRVLPNLAAMLVAVACDLKARMIPLECCAALAAAGGALQALAAGPAGLAAGLVFAAVAAGACLAANRVAGRGRALPVGHGDIRCMAALSLATGAAAPAGLLACYMSAAAFSLAGLAARRLTLRSGIPMAPFLSLWLACGVACLAC